MAAEGVTAADLREIQGLVYSAWNTQHAYAAFVFVRLGASAPDARRWLAGTLASVTPAARAERPHEHVRYQLALAPSGLAKLGAPRTVLDALPEEAKDGMWSRKAFLGDDRAPRWELGDEGDDLDALVMIYTRDAADREQLVAVEGARARAAGATVAHVQLTDPLRNREHFGFADGLAQPYLPGPPALTGPQRPGQRVIATGEILLGYENAYGYQPAAPKWTGAADDAFGKNGTYLVFRKLEQDVPALWQWLAANAEALRATELADVEEPLEYLAAKVMGRWRSGASLMLAPARDDKAMAIPDKINAFDYERDDAAGLRCPIAAHVRRANPRDARGDDADASLKVVDRHRIVRRGRSYGTPMTVAEALAHVARPGEPTRGLYFICLQASIARGFEFIQQTWLGSPGFNGLHHEVDPIMGNQPQGDPTAPRYFTIPRSPVRLRLANVPRVVRARGGGYFFLPSRSALAQLAGARG